MYTAMEYDLWKDVIADLRIDNGDFRLISLRFTFFIIFLCLYGPF